MSDRRIFPLYPPTRRNPRRYDSRESPLPYRGPVVREDSGEYTALVEIDWDAGTEYYAFTSVRSPSVEYLPYVESISPIRREISLTGGLSSGQCTVELVNSPIGQDRYFSKKLASVDVRGRKFRVKIVNISEGYSAAMPVFEGKIISWEISGGLFKGREQDNRLEEIFQSLLWETGRRMKKGNFTGWGG